MPVQVSATSQIPAAGRQLVPDRLNTSTGQAADMPVQVSAMSQTPAEARQLVPDGLNTSAGQAADMPVQVSAMSQTPAEARQLVPEDLSTSAGQAVATPLHVSARSQLPADARHVVLAARGAHAPFVAAPAPVLHAWQSVGSLFPQAELQHTPSAQKPDKHCEPVAHATPISSLQVAAPLHDPFMHSLSGSFPVTIGPHVPLAP
jgi:hypothetical protein